MNNKNSKNNQIRKAKQTSEQKLNQINNKETNNKNIHTNKSKKETKNKHNKLITILIIFGVTFLVAILGTVMGGKMIEGRTNPPAYPPNWLFPVAWGILYVLIALATYLAYMNAHNTEKRNLLMVWYGIHLFFNLFWPLFYFRLDLLIVSCFILLAMIITSIVITFKYFRTHLTSGWLFTIYTLWLLYAMYLNLGITLLNL